MTWGRWQQWPRVSFTQHGYEGTARTGVAALPPSLLPPFQQKGSSW
jgi:hypothetical protein